jgi:hypothetical protein
MVQKRIIVQHNEKTQTQLIKVDSSLHVPFLTNQAFLHLSQVSYGSLSFHVSQ